MQYNAMHPDYGSFIGSAGRVRFFVQTRLRLHLRGALLELDGKASQLGFSNPRGEHGLDGFGKPLQTIDAGDEDVLHAPVAQFGDDLAPELGPPRSAPSQT